MENIKEQIIKVVNELPENTTWDDALYTLYIQSKLKKSQEDINNGKVLSMKELKEYIDRMEEKNAVNTI